MTYPLSCYTGYEGSYTYCTMKSSHTWFSVVTPAIIQPGVIQAQLARKIGETQTFVSKFERGERRIQTPRLKAEPAMIQKTRRIRSKRFFRTGRVAEPSGRKERQHLLDKSSIGTEMGSVKLPVVMTTPPQLRAIIHVPRGGSTDLASFSRIVCCYGWGVPRKCVLAPLALNCLPGTTQWYPAKGTFSSLRDRRLTVQRSC